MTREQAIHYLERIKQEYDCSYEEDALDMAIQALEQQSMPTIALPDIDKKVESYKELLKHPVIKHIMDMDETQEQLDFVQPPATLTVGDDCISRQQAKAYLYDRIDRLKDNELYDIFSKIIDDMVNELPPVKHQERTGHWIKTIGENGITSAVRCSKCGFEDNRYMLFRYCPDCGARMEVEKNG